MRHEKKLFDEPELDRIVKKIRKSHVFDHLSVERKS